MAETNPGRINITGNMTNTKVIESTDSPIMAGVIFNGLSNPHKRYKNQKEQ